MHPEEERNTESISVPHIFSFLNGQETLEKQAQDILASIEDLKTCVDFNLKLRTIIAIEMKLEEMAEKAAAMETDARMSIAINAFF
jgi:hypothetical protein